MGDCFLAKSKSHGNYGKLRLTTWDCVLPWCFLSKAAFPSPLLMAPLRCEGNAFDAIDAIVAEGPADLTQVLRSISIRLKILNGT